jgi:hypothetical protein
VVPEAAIARELSQLLCETYPRRNQGQGEIV